MRTHRVVNWIGKRVVKSLPILRRHVMSSSDYRLLAGVEEARRIATSSAGWLTARTVMRQERAYQRLIGDMKRGRPRLDFKVAVEAIVATGIQHPTVLEVGCGSGSYSEVFATLIPEVVRYTGADYSKAMIASARIQYPTTAFEVADATNLPFRDGAFDVVLNGVSLMHIIDYEAAIREAARAASHCCVFHSVPVFFDHQTTFLTKYAYGAPVIEIIYRKQELISLIKGAGLRLAREWRCIPYDVHEATGHHSLTETYLCIKEG